MARSQHESPETISTRAPRTEGDIVRGTATLYRRPRYFNPRPPHGGRHLRSVDHRYGGGDFNPRPPHGGRHLPAHQRRGHSRYFNPRPPHGGRMPRPASKSGYFNPRPPHGGRR